MDLTGGSASKEFAMQETWVRSLGLEDTLEEGIWQPTLVFLLGEFHE